MKEKVSWVTFDANIQDGKQHMVCERCKETYAIDPKGMPVTQFCDKLEGFAFMHRHCKEPGVKP